MSSPAVEERLARARSVVEDLAALAAEHGLPVDPRLSVEGAPVAAACYDPTRCRITITSAGEETAAERSYWAFFASLLGAATVPEARAAIDQQLPFLLGHEIGHHLRDRYGAVGGSRFYEEQAANVIGVSLVAGHDDHRATLPALQRHAERTVARLAPLVPAAAGHAPAFRLCPGDVTLPPGVLDSPRARSTALSRCEEYFNAGYGRSMYEYILFGASWLSRYMREGYFHPLRETLREWVPVS